MSDEKDSALRTGSGPNECIYTQAEMDQVGTALGLPKCSFGDILKAASLNKSDDCPEKSFTDGYSAGYACGRSGSARKDFDALVAWRAARCASPVPPPVGFDRIEIAGEHETLLFIKVSKRQWEAFQAWEKSCGSEEQEAVHRVNSEWRTWACGEMDRMRALLKASPTPKGDGS